MGYNALAYNIIGEYNSAFGFYSLHYNTGNFNTAVGPRSLQLNSSGNRNTFIGYNSLTANTLGSYNTAIGFESLVHNQSGNNNTVIGNNTGNGIISGSKNTIIGANVTGLTPALSNSIILADGDGNPRIFVNHNGNVGVGTTNLTTGIKLNVNGNIFTNCKILINSDLAHAGNFSLAVNGEAIFNRAVVRLYGSWPDYVFNEKYSLEPLSEVEKFIKVNKHLKGIQIASDVEKNGIDIAENQKKLLEKVEELTLYIIEQEKAINQLKNELNVIKKSVTR